MNLEARDVVALVALLGGFVLIGFGIDSVVGGILVMITTYYFGSVERYRREKPGLAHL